MTKNFDGLLGRVIELINEVFDSDSEFTNYCRVPHNFVTRAKGRGYLNPTVETILLIKEGVFEKTKKELRWQWLLEDKGEMFLNDQKTGSSRSVKYSEAKAESIAEVIKNNPELQRKLSLLLSQLEMSREYLINMIAESEQ